MGKNVLLVGGAGYVGGAITDYYCKYFKEKINLYVYDIILYEESYRKKINFIYGDVRDTNYLLDICKKYDIDIVIWLAAIVGDDACNVDMLLTKEVNVDSLKNFIGNFDGKFIYTSSASVYGVQKSDELLKEEDETNAISLYASTKLECEKALKEKNSIILRMGTLFGVGDTYSRIRFDLIINKLVLNSIKDKKLIIFGGKQYRPFLHVKDAARTIFQSIFINANGIFNICYKNEKIENLISLFENYFPDVKIEIQPMDFVDTRNYRIDSTKAEKYLYFKPNLTLADGIEDIKDLLTEKRIKDLSSIRYNNYLYLHALNKFEKSGMKI